MYTVSWSGMDVDEVMPAIEESDEQPVAPKVYIPGSHTLGKDEILEPDDSVYIMRHSMNVNWPCLSFDVLRDNLGYERQRYPATAYIVSGTQADQAKNNEINVYKMSSLHKTQKDNGKKASHLFHKILVNSYVETLDDSDSDDDDDNDDGLDEDAVLEHRSIPHMGGVNRVRAQPLPHGSPLPPVSHPYYVASWADTGKVHIWNVRPVIESLDIPGASGYDKKPAFTNTSHGHAEGFAMDWAASSPESASSSLRLLTGDIHAKIYLTTAGPAGFNALPQPFLSHTSSVEDLQWSPVEGTVFASCSADRSVLVWDVRVRGRRSVAGIPGAHESDVNVISWNRATTNLLVSGGDEGGIKVWDLRNVAKKEGSVSLSVPFRSRVQCGLERFPCGI
jgi:ribosome assembly protein RRB1